MDALILAAGRGKRMRSLTDYSPKCLLKAGGRSLVEYLLEGLARAGITRIVINHAHLGDQIVAQLGNGRRYGVHIGYSNESSGVLDTGGGIFKALDLLRSDPFAVINGDIWTDYPFGRLPRTLSGLAHLVLVDNPIQHPQGDFVLQDTRVVAPEPDERRPTLTYSGVGVYARALFKGCPSTAFPLAPLLYRAATEGKVTGEYYAGRWEDVGTPERLARLDQELTNFSG